MAIHIDVCAGVDPGTILHILLVQPGGVPRINDEGMSGTGAAFPVEYEWPDIVTLVLGFPNIVQRALGLPVAEVDHARPDEAFGESPFVRYTPADIFKCPSDVLETLLFFVDILMQLGKDEAAGHMQRMTALAGFPLQDREWILWLLSLVFYSSPKFFVDLPLTVCWQHLNMSSSMIFR